MIGENAKPDDLEVNPMKSKQLTNFRSTGKDDAIRLTPPRVMTLEQAIAYIDDDEMVEVTPKIDPAAQGDPRPARAQEGAAEAGGGLASEFAPCRRNPPNLVHCHRNPQFVIVELRNYGDGAPINYVITVTVHQLAIVAHHHLDPLQAAP